MIPVSRDEILPRFAGIPAVLQNLHKLHRAITCKTFHPGWTGSLLCTAGTKRLIWRQSVRKKVNKYLCRFSSLYRKWKCSAKELFLKILQYSQENTYVGVSLPTFKSAILSKRDSKANVFLWILRNF